jgi:GntR family transcriptional regulator, transcriptional repressor for pyruvate dehydrogenase complex
VQETNNEQQSSIFNEVKYARGFESIVTQIQQAVYNGKLKAGDRLPNERELVNLFGVSRPTIREAFRVLEAEGLVEIRRGVNGGAYITEPNPDQAGKALEALIRFHGASISELVEFRGNFEAESAYWAALRATDEQISRLQKLASQFSEKAKLAETPWVELVDIDISFHEEVAYATHNQIRVAIMLAIHEVIRKTSLTIEGKDTADWRKQQSIDLQEVAEAIKDKNQQLARDKMEEHVLRNVKAVTNDN